MELFGGDSKGLYMLNSELKARFMVRYESLPANPYCPANFKCRAFLPQPFKGSCSQIWRPVTGGAYHSARRVNMCVRSG